LSRVHVADDQPTAHPPLEVPDHRRAAAIVLSLGRTTPSAGGIKMTACIGRREFITLLGGAGRSPTGLSDGYLERASVFGSVGCTSWER
jgi:hypothetical protein